MFVLSDYIMSLSSVRTQRSVLILKECADFFWQSRNVPFSSLLYFLNQFNLYNRIRMNKRGSGLGSFIH